MRFKVRVLDGADEVRTLVLEAADDHELAAQAAGQGWTLLSTERADATPGRLSSSRRSFEHVLFAQELQALLEAGLNVIESLDALIERTTAPASRSVMQSLRRHLTEGHRLSTAMGRLDEAFPPLMIGIVMAAEDTSNLPQALQRYVDYENQVNAIRHRLVSASIYPAVLVVVGVLVGCFLLGYVVPRFATVYQGNLERLPAASRWLLQWGQAVADHGALAAAVLLGAGLSLVWGVRQLLARRTPAELLAAFPQLARQLQQMELARLYLTVGILLEGGIPITRALQLAQAVLPPGRRPGLAQVQALVVEGRPFSTALERCGFTTSVGLRLVQVGERTGRLGAMLVRAAQFHDAETSRWIDRFSRLVEPALMVTIGLVVGLVVLLLYMPVFELAGSFQ